MPAMARAAGCFGMAGLLSMLDGAGRQ